MALANMELKIIKQPDSKIINAIRESAEGSGSNLESINLALKLGGSGFGGNLSQIDENLELKEYLDLNSEIIQNFTFTISCGDDNRFVVKIARPKDSPLDNLSLSFAPIPDNKRPIISKFYSIILEKLKVVDSSKVIHSELNEQLNHHYEMREAELSKMENISTSLLFRTEEFIRAKENEYIKRQADLDSQIESKKNQLDVEYKKKEEELVEERNRLDSKLKEIDDRENKHVRREIRKDLKEEFKNRSVKFELTKGTIRLRKPIFIFTFILLVLFGSAFFVLLYLSSKELLSINTNYSNLISLSIKQIALGLAFGSTAVFFIRWNNRWFEHHSNEEFRLKRYEIDLERASWLIELAMEWKEEKGTGFPLELLKMLGRNLFEDDKADNSPLHPSDQLASAILGSAAEINLKAPGGTEVKLDKKGIESLKN